MGMTTKKKKKTRTQTLWLLQLRGSHINVGVSKPHNYACTLPHSSLTQSAIDLDVSLYEYSLETSTDFFNAYFHHPRFMERTLMPTLSPLLNISMCLNYLC